MTEIRNETGTGQPLGQVATLMRNLYPCSAVTRDGAVVGCWYVAAATATPSCAEPEPASPANVYLIGAMRTADGRGVGIMEAFDAGSGLNLDAVRGLAMAGLRADTAGRRAAEASFAGAVRAMLGFIASSDDGARRVPFPAAMRATLRSVLGWEPDRADVDAAATSWAQDASAKLRLFLRTLDPWALRFLAGREDLRDCIGAAWPGLDRTFLRDAPLRTALEANPHRARSILGSWPSRSEGLRAAIRGGDLLQWLDRLVVDAGIVPAHMTAILAEAEAALPGAPDGSRPGGRDAVSLVRRLTDLPLSERPHGQGEWEAFHDLAPVLDEVAGWEGVMNPAARLLWTGPDWSARLRTLRAAARTEDLPAAMARVATMCTAFAKQVLMPAATVARGRPADVRAETWEAWSNAARTIMLSGLPLAAIIRLGSDWAGPGTFGHGQEWASGRDHTWPACLPDARYHRLSIHVLTSADDIRKEIGRMHPEGSGAGHHEALRLIGACVQGRSRVASVRIARDGGAVSIGTLELSLAERPFSVVRSFDPYDASRHPDLAGAVSRYFRDARSGRLAADPARQALVRTSPSIHTLCGFDPWDGDAWNDSVRSWGALMPARLRSAQPWQFARLVGKHMWAGPPRLYNHLIVPTRTDRDGTRAELAPRNPSPCP